MSKSQQDNKIFSIFDWVNSYLDVQDHLNNENMQHILEFSLMWNLFESEALNNNANAEAIEKNVKKAISDKKIKKSDYQSFVEFFQTRYKTSNSTNSDFEGLEFRKKDKRQLVENVILGQEIDLQNQMIALLLIAYRIRNNTFHGLKDAVAAQSQKELFDKINLLLAKYLENIK